MPPSKSIIDEWKKKRRKRPVRPPPRDEISQRSSASRPVDCIDRGSNRGPGTPDSTHRPLARGEGAALKGHHLIFPSYREAVETPLAGGNSRHCFGKPSVAVSIVALRGGDDTLVIPGHAFSPRRHRRRTAVAEDFGSAVRTRPSRLVHVEIDFVGEGRSGTPRLAEFPRCASTSPSKLVRIARKIGILSPTTWGFVLLTARFPDRERSTATCRSPPSWKVFGSLTEIIRGKPPVKRQFHLKRVESNCSEGIVELPIGVDGPIAGRHWIHPLYELPFTGGFPDNFGQGSPTTFQDGEIGKLPVDRFPVRGPRACEHEQTPRWSVTIPIFRAIRTSLTGDVDAQREFPRARACRAALANENLSSDRCTSGWPRSNRRSEIFSNGCSTPIAAEVEKRVSGNDEGIITARARADIDTATDGFPNNERLFLPPTVFKPLRG